MAEKALGAGRVFASDYQIAICDDPAKAITDDENWDEDAMDLGFAGAESFRMVGTEADLNDHWVELAAADTGPEPDDWERVICLPFHSASGWIHIMSLADAEPVVSAEIGPGDYAVFVAVRNIGTDLLSLGEEQTLSDTELAARKDLEWYRIFLVPGKPERIGRIKDLEGD